MNLKDIKNSGLKTTETEKPKENVRQPTSNDTMQKSNPLPKDSILQKQSETIQEQSAEILRLQTALEESSQELSYLKQNGRPEDSLRISMLESELQKKSGTIVSLNDRIGKLSGADLILKKNEQLEKENRGLFLSEQNAREEAAVTISNVKEEYSVKIAAAIKKNRKLVS